MEKTRRKSAKPSSALDTRLSARVSEEAYQRLFVTSVMNKLTAGEILDRLIRDHCREYSLPGKITARDNTNHRVNLASQVNDSAPAPAIAEAA